MSARTGHFGFIVNTKPDEVERMTKRAGEMVSRHVRDLAEDGRDFLIRTRRTMADSESAGAMFTNSELRYKVIIWVALETYGQAQVGEHAFLPLSDTMHHPPIEWFVQEDTYIDDGGNEQPCTVNIAKIEDRWFTEGFIMEFNRSAYLRIEPPEIEELVPMSKERIAIMI